MKFQYGILILVAMILLISPVFAQLSTYYYYKDLSISGSSGEQTNYIKRFDLYRLSVVDINETIYLNSNVNISFSDIYFVKASDDTALNFMFEVRNDTYASVLVNIPTLPVSGTTIRLYYGNTTMNSLAATELPGVITTYNYSQDNNGIERFFFKDDFSSNTFIGYIVTGTPSIASGTLTLSSADKIIKVLQAGDATGLWEARLQYTTDWVSGTQSLKQYFGSTSYLDIQRNDGDFIWLQFTVNGASLIATTNTTVSLADSIYGRGRIVYDGTNYQMYWNDVAVGATTAGSSPTSPSIGLLATDSVIVIDELMYAPSIAYSDPVSEDKTKRYINVSGTALTFDTNHYHMVANTDSKYRLKSYQFGAGQQIYKMTLPAGGTDGDYIYVQFAGTSDMTKGYGLGVNRTGGVWNECTVLNGIVTNTGFTIIGLSDGDTVYVKVEFDPNHGVWYGEVSESGVWM